jgi:hypothetical protein
LKCKGLPVFQLDARYLRLRNGLELALGDGGAEVLGQNRFHHFLPNLLGETAANQRLRDFARTEPGNARILLIAFGDSAEIAGDFVRGNFDFYFSRAVRVQGRTAWVCSWPSWSCPSGDWPAASSVAVDTPSDWGEVSIISVELNVCLPGLLAPRADAILHSRYARIGL